MILIRCVSLANGEPGPAGQFLKDYDPDTGESLWTHEVTDAEPFNSKDEAYSLWMSVLESEPVRSHDGKPNRPLTAFTVEIGEF